MSDAFLTGAFGIVVALVTWLLAGFRQRDVTRREAHIESLRSLEGLYASEIEALEMVIRITNSGGDYGLVERELSKNNALLRLRSTKQINDQVETVSKTMQQWSAFHRSGKPRPVGHTGVSISSGADLEYAQKAEALYPRLNDEIAELINLMANHLARERRSL